MKVTETRSVVPHGTAMPTPTVTAWYEQRQVDAWRDILTTIVPSGAFDRTYISTIQYTWPAILALWDGDPTSAPDPALGLFYNNAFEERNERSVFMITVNLREAFVDNVYAKVHEELITAASAATLLSAADNNIAYDSAGALGTASTRAHIWAPRTRDLSYDGLMFQLRVPNVICDGDIITATANSDDTYYGPSAVDTYQYYQSDPSASAYVSLIGEEVCIADEITPWQYGLFKRTRTTIEVK